jgi:hypothetical protein
LAPFFAGKPDLVVERAGEKAEGGAVGVMNFNYIMM